MRNNNIPFAVVFGFFSIHFEENQKTRFQSESECGLPEEVRASSQPMNIILQFFLRKF